MSERHERDRLEDVLDAFVASTVWPTSAHVDEWVRRFPEFATELTRCAANWRLMQVLTMAPDEAESSDDVLIRNGKAIVGKLLAPEAPVVSIDTTARVPQRWGGRQVLLVDDDRELVDLLAFALRRAGLEPLPAYDATSALQVFIDKQPDLALLDINLGRGNGLDVLKALRERSQVPVIMLTALDAEGDKVRGLELGADDYLTKPFSHRELLARIRVQLRRVGMAQGTRADPAVSLEGGPIVLDTRTHTVTKHGQPVSLTVIEFRLLHVLMLHAGSVVQTPTLLKQVWNYTVDTGGADVVRVTIHRLRRKLEDDPSRPMLLRTIPGVGVLFTAPLE